VLFGCPSSSTCSFDFPHRDRFVHDAFVFTTSSLRGCPFHEFVPTSSSFGFPIDTLIPRHSHHLVAPRGEFVSRRAHRLVAHAMSLFSRRRLSCSAPQKKSVASTLASHGCPCSAFVAPRSRRSFATIVEFVVFTHSINRLPGCPSRSCARLFARLPEREPVRFRSPSPGFPGDEGPSRFGLPNLRSALHHRCPGSKTLRVSVSRSAQRHRRRPPTRSGPFTRFACAAELTFNRLPDQTSVPRHGLPNARRRLRTVSRALAPPLERLPCSRHHALHGCPCEAFSSSRSCLRDERVAVRRSHRKVAHAMRRRER